MDRLAPLIETLNADGRLRVWSLVISVFGDLVQHRGGAMDTARLQRILGRIGVEPGAVRTALSRLSRDGWVTGDRNGRISTYRLTPEGVGSFAQATQQIYAAPHAGPVTEWWFETGTEAAGLPFSGGVLRPAGDTLDPGVSFRLAGRITEITEEVRAGFLSDDHRASLDRLAQDLEALGPGLTDPHDAAAARMLLIHRWRRIVLRFPDIPPELMPADSPLAHPRAAVAAGYRALLPLAEAWLDTEEDGMAAMPPSDGAEQTRFVPRA